MTNKMQEVKIEKVVLSIGGTAERLEKGKKLLEIITKKKACKRESTKRIPSLEVRPGLEVGALVTLRKGEAKEILKRLFAAIDNKLRKKQIIDGSLSFGIKEYIEIPGMQYQREIGITGMDVSVSFARAGKRVKMKKIKAGKLPKKSVVKKEEIIQFLQENLGIKLEG